MLHAPKITILLGPTNTGKTFYAIERMLGYQSGMIGFPLRLLARENYDRLVARVGVSQVALITGEEKILPKHARFYCCTVEAMPLEVSVECLAIDEVQLASDSQRGHVFTDRILHARGRHETLLLGAETMRPLLKKLLPDAVFETRMRLSRLTYSGQKKVTRLLRRSAIVAFSAPDVYHLAETVRRQRGGTAVVMGALSPRTRNAQVDMYQSGEVDFLIATDAIGMGLNMDIQHVALAADTKFDGKHMRHLYPAELAQIVGRAGRYTQDGTFGVTQGCRPLEDNMIDAIENHIFPPHRQLYWRNRKLSFESLRSLLSSLDAPAPEPFLLRKADAIDHLTLQALAVIPDIAELASNKTRLRLLWDVAQIPDFRNMMTDSHTVMLARIYMNLATSGKLDKKWVATQLSHLERLDGDIDALMTRIAHIRTWTYITHKTSWTDEPEEWQHLARTIEDRLSDELHNRLTQRFVDKRAAHLSRRLKEATNLISSVKMDGTVIVEGEEVGTLNGFTFLPAISENDEKAMILAAARKALPDEIERRVKAVIASAEGAFKLDEKAGVNWRDTNIARLVKSEQLYSPRVEVFDSELLSIDQKQRIKEKLTAIFKEQVDTLLGNLLKLQNIDLADSKAKNNKTEQKEISEVEVLPQSKAEPIQNDAAALNTQQATHAKQPENNLIEAPIDSDEPGHSDETGQEASIQQAPMMSGIARGIMFRLYENLGVMSRTLISDQLKEMPDSDKPFLARAGIRIGTETVFMPELLKPAAIKLRVMLYSIYNQDFPACGPPPEGRVSIDLVEGIADNYWLSAGYRRIGDKVMRVDMVERVAALVRTAARSGEFGITDEMLSLAGVGRDIMASMIVGLGFEKVREEPAEDPEKPAIPVFIKKQRQNNRRMSNAKSGESAGRQQNQNKKGGAQSQKPFKRNNNQKGSHQKANHQKAANKASKPVDVNPHSPFAILANLKK